MAGRSAPTSLEPATPASPSRSPAHAGRPLRVLFLATYFPKPANRMLGPWALLQAQAFQRQGADVRVVSGTSWVPRLLARTPGAKAYADCPPSHQWGDLPVDYPRWLYYPIEPLKRWGHRRPGPQLKLAWLSARPGLLRLVRQWRPDVIFCHHTLPNGYMAYRLNRLFGIPYVVTDHAFAETLDCERYPGRYKSFARVAERAHTMIAMAEVIERTLRRLFPRVRAQTVHNGTVPVPPAIQVTPRPPELAGKLVLFSAGILVPQKGFTLLIRALAQLKDKYSNAVLRIAGDGQYRGEIEQAIREGGLAGRVKLLGFVSHDRVLQEMVWCDAFALVGAKELFATVFIEAMSAGKPVITASDGGINDVVKDGVHGFAVTPGDESSIAGALDRMLSDEQARRRMGAAALELFRTELNWDTNARTMLGIFRQAVASQKL